MQIHFNYHHYHYHYPKSDAYRHNQSGKRCTYSTRKLLQSILSQRRRWRRHRHTARVCLSTLSYIISLFPTDQQPLEKSTNINIQHQTECTKITTSPSPHTLIKIDITKIVPSVHKVLINLSCHR